MNQPPPQGPPPEPSSPPDQELGQPAPLKDEFTTGFKVVLFDGTVGLAELIKNFSAGTQLMAQRADVPMTTDVVVAPDHADTTLQPAVDSVFKFEPLLRKEDPSLLRQQSMPRVHQAVDQIKFYSDFIDMIEPLYQGAIARKRRAQGVVDTFCRSVYTDGASTINRVAAANPSVTPPVTEGTGKIPLVGARAPGQDPVPPGAMPVIPPPLHPKPARRGTGGAVPKNKKKGPPAPPRGRTGK